MRVSCVLTAAACWSGAEAGDRAPFSWGTATAAYQVEGSREVGDRQPSIWDCFDTDIEGAGGSPCESIKSTKPNNKTNVFLGENAATADDDFDRYPQTVEELKKFGFGAYRMSVSWSRVISFDSDGGQKPVGRVNKDGVAHYHQVLAALKKAGIDVALTMWHWDTPQALENYAYHNPKCKVPKTKTGSFWLCPDSNEYFRDYAKLLVQEFGVKLGTESPVKWWITLNEPLTIAENGYSGSGPHAPGRCSDRTVCWDGDDSSEPFTVAHNMLRAHAEAFHQWKGAGLESGKNGTSSLCGITLNGDYALAADPSSQADLNAANRSMEYQMAVWADPIFYGKWPDSVMHAHNAGLISVPTLDKALIHGTHVNVYFQNHYTTNFVWDAGKPGAGGGFTASANFSNSGYHPVTKKAIGLPSSNGWLYDYPPGLPLLQDWLHKRYPMASFIVTENGWGNATATESEDIKDLIRCNYYRNYVGNMSANAAKHDGPRVLGFFAWSIMDNYEWADGFSTRFGLTYVDYKSQVRTPKLSMKWWGEVTKLTSLPKNGNAGLPSCEAMLADM